MITGVTVPLDLLARIARPISMTASLSYVLIVECVKMAFRTTVAFAKLDFQEKIVKLQ